MCQLQSPQSLGLKGHYTIITHRAHIVGVRCQCQQHLQRTFSKHGFNKPLGRWRWRNDLIRHISLDQIPKHSLGYSFRTTWTTHRG